MPPNLKEIGNHAFFQTKMTGNLVIPDFVITIGSYAFKSTKFVSLTLGNNVEVINSRVFRLTQ